MENSTDQVLTFYCGLCHKEFRIRSLTALKRYRDMPPCPICGLTIPVILKI
jgi:hypothetical protein